MAGLTESVEIEHFPPEERDAQVRRLEEPWIADEGPLDARFRRGVETEPLRPRGFAFDLRTTVVWDEAGVQVLRAAEARSGVTSLRSQVLLREWLTPPSLTRVDYLERGCLIGSRYLPPEGGAEEGGHA